MADRPPVQCEVCSRPVAQPKRGYRNVHAECRALHDDLNRLQRHLDQLTEGTHPAALSRTAMSELWFRLFTMASEVPRVRDSRGRYVSSRISDEYLRERDARRRRKAESG